MRTRGFVGQKSRTKTAPKPKWRHQLSHN